MKALELAAYVVNKCVNDPSLSITNLQLQKIMYFLQIRALKDNGSSANLLKALKRI